MSVLTIKPAKLSGAFLAPPSKSLSHRAIIAAALSHKTSVLKNVVCSNDVLETLKAVKALGANFCFSNGTLAIFGGLGQRKINNSEEIKISCLESASTVRFLIPVVAALGFKAKFVVSRRLFERIISCGEVLFCKVENCCFRVVEKLKPGCFCFKKCLTSQFISGLLLALPILEKNSLIFFEPGLESKSFVHLTIGFLKSLGIKILSLKNGFKVFGNQFYRPFNYEIEGDFSLASFFMLAGCFKKIELSGLNFKTNQADLKIIKLLSWCGARVQFKSNSLIVQPSAKKLNCFSFNLKNHIDLAPVLAVLASACSGVSRLFGASRLEVKESNRAKSILKLINSLGGFAAIFNDCLEIRGVDSFSGGVVNCYNDHRIAMAAAIASCMSKNQVVLIGADCVKKSWPNFFNVFKSLGGKTGGFKLE